MTMHAKQHNIKNNNENNRMHHVLGKKKIRMSIQLNPIG